MNETKSFLQENHFDIFDLLEWNDLQIKKGKKEHKIIHEKYKSLLEKFKEHHFRGLFETSHSEPMPVQRRSLSLRKVRKLVSEVINPPV